MSSTIFTSFMPEALELAHEAQKRDEIPVGAVIVKNGEVIGRGHNLTRTTHDPSAHAEIVAIREAAKTLGTDRLVNCDLWVTLEPCAMCAGAISHARIGRLYYGAHDIKGGAVESGLRFFQTNTCHHAPEVYSGVSAEAAAKLLRNYFTSKR